MVEIPRYKYFLHYDKDGKLVAANMTSGFVNISSFQTHYARTDEVTESQYDLNWMEVGKEVS